MWKMCSGEGQNLVHWISIIAAAIMAFVSTNLDDLVVLMLFFSQVNSNFRPHHIFTGQYLGFSIILIASLPGFFSGLFLPAQWISVFGLIPIAIGIYALFNRESEDESVQAVSGEEWQRSRLRQLLKRIPIVSLTIHLFPPQTYQVAAVTFANGGDNISIYVPLFARLDWVGLLVTLGVFFSLIALWCSAADQFTRHPLIAPAIARYGRAIVPFVLIGLGLSILIGHR
jgi:cadmium resistance protein CadD (predicted permease)